MSQLSDALFLAYGGGGGRTSSGGLLQGADASAIGGKAALLSGMGGHVGISPETMLARKAANLQLKQMKRQNKRQDQIFDMLLGTGGEGGGMLGGLFGSLTGSGGAGGNVSQPGFQEGPGGGGGAPQLGQSPGFPQGGYGSGQRAALQEQFRVAQNNLLGSMEARGMGGSSLVGPGLASVARQQSLASGELEDRLFREQLQFRAAERAPLFGLLGQLLGSVGV